MKDEEDTDYSQPVQDGYDSAVAETAAMCAKARELVSNIQKKLSALAVSVPPADYSVRRNMILQPGKKVPSAADLRCQLDMEKERKFRFTEIQVDSSQLLGALNADDLCHFRAEPSHWRYDWGQPLFQFGVYGELSLALLLDLGFKVVITVGKTIQTTASNLFSKDRSFKKLFDTAARDYDVIVKENSLVRDDIKTSIVKDMIVTIGTILLKLQTCYHEAYPNSIEQMLCRASYDLIIRILLIKPTLDGEQATAMSLLIDFDTKWLCFTTSDKSAAFAVKHNIPVLSEYKVGTQSTATKTQFILEPTVVFRFLYLHTIRDINVLDKLILNPQFVRAAVMCGMSPEKYLHVIKGVRSHIKIPKGANGRHWGAKEETSLRFKRKMDTLVDDTKTVYKWLCDDSMDLWAPPSIIVYNRYFFYGSRMFYNYHGHPDNINESGVIEPLRDAANVFDHDYDGLLLRFYLGHPIYVHGKIVEFAKECYHIDMPHSIGAINFEEQLLNILKIKERDVEEFCDNCYTYLIQDSFILANITGAVKDSIQHSAETEPRKPKRKAPAKLDHPEYNQRLFDIHPLLAILVDNVGDSLNDNNAENFERMWRQYVACKRRCMALQSSTRLNGEDSIIVSRMPDAWSATRDPLAAATATAGGLYESHIRPLKLPGGISGPVDLDLSVGGTNMSINSVEIRGPAYDVDAAHNPTGTFTFFVKYLNGQELRYGGKKVAFVHRFQNNDDDPDGTEAAADESHLVFTTTLLKTFFKKPSCLTAESIPYVINIFREHLQENPSPYTLYSVISQEIAKITRVNGLLANQLSEQISAIFNKIFEIFEKNKRERKEKTAVAQSFWKEFSSQLIPSIKSMDQLCGQGRVQGNAAVIDSSLSTIFKYLENVLCNGEKHFRTILLQYQGRHDNTQSQPGQSSSTCALSEPLGGATSTKKGGWWENLLGNVNQKVIGYSFADIGNDLVLKPIYSEEEYKKIEHRQYINILLNIRQQQIKNRIKQEQQAILNKQKPMISAIRKSLGFKPLRPVISYPQSQQPDLSKQKTMFSAVGNTIKRIIPVRNTISVRREGGKLTKKIKKTKQTRKYKLLSNKRTSYKLYR
jgi:hypothetical protein